MPLSTVQEALADIRAGKMIILVDEPDRENEGDLTIAAEFVTPDVINFMATHARGWICVALDDEIADSLDLPVMVANNNSRFRTNFTITVEAATGVTTGISAQDRARTIQIMVRPGSKSQDLVRPGHIQPIRARKGGVLVRTGQTEGSVDLARLAGLRPAAVICEIMHTDGTMARMPQLEEFAAKHGIKILSVTQIIEHRRLHERLIAHEETVKLPTSYGDFDLHMFRSIVDERPHFALTTGIPIPDKTAGNDPIDEPILVRPHSECLTGDVFHSLRCDCGAQLDQAMRVVQEAKKGVVLYMRQEGRGIGIQNKIRAYKLQDEGMDTVEANQALGFRADQRDYGVGAQILRHLGIRKMRMLTNNPRKFRGLDGYGLAIVERVPIRIEPNPANEKYLLTKKNKLGHLL